ncbi:uncharacterized protein [Rutidosis leptorrhynchoides]|uniref:uncharacterized protein n=1 Tax=Rutidosis leptorrhynchoides TaxID=125765 RepID=UPI003A9A3987
MVKKLDGGWRMCVDFTNIIKACPKDCYPLPEIDWKVKSLNGYQYKSFLDAYKGYHQIKMAKEDEEKTSFFTSRGIYCYQKMPFGLKNAGATYQRLVDKAFHNQLGRNLEGNVDDMKGNPSKSRKGRQAQATPNPSNHKRHAEFEWEIGIIQQEYIAKLPTLTSLEEGEMLFIYLAASKECISSFLVTERENSTDEEDAKNSTQVITPRIENEEWKLYTDGASSSDGSGAGLMLVNLEGKEFTYALRFEFATTNNEAEYEALLAGLRMVKELKILHLRAFVDSQLVANQVMGTFEARQPTIQQYSIKAKELIESFKSFDIEHVRQSQNKMADALSKLASLTFEHLANEVLVEVLEKKSILEEEFNDIIQEDEVTWMTPLQVYLETGKLPEDKNEARKIMIKAPSYKMMNGALYRRSFLTPWLQCVGPK